MTQMNCPACYKPAQTDRLVGTQAYCSCGLSWDINGKISKSENQASSGARTIVIFSILLVSTVLHYVTWDQFSLEIIPLKIKQLTGLAKAKDYLEIATICEKRQKTACQLDSLKQAYQLNNKDLRSLALAADIHMKKTEYKQAAQLFQTYFSHSEALPVHRASYALALNEIGDLKGAEIQYKQVLSQDNKEPNFVAARAYVDVLIKTSALDKAKGVIEEYRKATPTSALFLDKEWKLINAQMKSRTVTHNRLPASHTAKQ